MRVLTFASRSFKEIIKDPLSIIFTIILPLFLLYIFQQFKIPNEVYNIENFTPGIVIFSLSFITMFTSSLVSKDMTTSLITRLLVSPMKSFEYILGYFIAVVPILLLQNILFFLVAVLLGLSYSINIIYAILLVIIFSILFISLGILIGSITSTKASTGVSSVIVELVAFTSGMYFSTDMLSKTFNVICNVLPFKSILNILKGVLNGNYSNMLFDILLVFVYIIIIFVITIIVFKRRIIGDKK